MAHENVFLVADVLEKNPGMTYTQAVKSLAQQEKLMSAAKTTVAKEAAQAPVSAVAKNPLLPPRKQLEKDAATSMGTQFAPVMSPFNPLLKKTSEIALAASPYLSPGTGAASQGIKAALKGLFRPGNILPTGAALKEGLSEDPSSPGTQADSAIGGLANVIRETFGRRIPGVGPMAQAAGAAGLEQFTGNLARQAIDEGPENVDLSQAAKSGGLGFLGGGIGGAIGARASTANATKKMEDLMSGPLKELNYYGTVKLFNEVKTVLSGYLKAPPSHLAKAGFDTATIRQFKANLNNTIDGLLDGALGFKGKNTVVINSANNTLRKFVDLMSSNPAAQKEIKEKTGEYLITKFLNPTTASKANLKEALMEVEKGGASALDKILSASEKQAMFSAIDNIKTIARTENLRDMRVGMSTAGNIMVWFADKAYLLTPGHMATHILEQAKKPNAGPVFSGLANYIRKLGQNPLTGGRLARAGTEYVEKELLRIGAKPISVKEGMGPQQTEHSGFFKPPAP